MLLVTVSILYLTKYEVQTFVTDISVLGKRVYS